MSIVLTIENDYKTAFKSHNQVAISLLRMVKSALKNAEIEARHDLTDAEAMVVLQREAKRRRESITMFTTGGRMDLVAKEQAELDELTHYLPVPLTDDELETIAKTVIAEMNPTIKDMGRVIGQVVQRADGRTDGQRASAVVKKLLS